MAIAEFGENQPVESQNGGQRGCVLPEQFQNISFPNRPKKRPENIGGLETVPNQVSPPIGIAAMWLSVHRDEIAGSAIAFVRKHFDLSITEAVNALQLGHALKYGG